MRSTEFADADEVVDEMGHHLELHRIIYTEDKERETERVQESQGEKDKIGKAERIGLGRAFTEGEFINKCDEEPCC